MRVRLSTDRIRRLAHAAGGWDRVFDAWPEDPAPSFTTIFRWMKRHDEVPSPRRKNVGRPSGEYVLNLAAALDVDPVTLFDYAPEDHDAALEELRELVVASGWDAVMFSSLTSVIREFARGESWPPISLMALVREADNRRSRGRRAVVRDWSATGFSHTATQRKNFYERRLLRFPREDGAPRVAHFAFKPAGSSRWRPYGFVLDEPPRIRLFCRHHTQEVITERADRRILVETFCGADAADFKIASIHPFEFTALSDDDIFDNFPLVTFPRSS